MAGDITMEMSLIVLQRKCCAATDVITLLSGTQAAMLALGYKYVYKWRL